MSTRVQTETEIDRTNSDNQQGPNTSFHVRTPQGRWMDPSMNNGSSNVDSNVDMGRGRTVGDTTAARVFEDQPMGTVGENTGRRRTHQVRPQPQTPADPVIRHIQYQSHPHAGDLLSYQIRRAEGLGSEESFPRLGGSNILPLSVRQAVSEEERSVDRRTVLSNNSRMEREGEQDNNEDQSTHPADNTTEAQEPVNAPPVINTPQIALPRTLAPQPYYAQTPLPINYQPYTRQFESVMGSALSRPPHWSEPRSLPPPYPVNFSTYREVNPIEFNPNRRLNEARQSALSDVTQSSIIHPQQTPIETFALLGARAREFARVTGHEGYHHLTHAEAIN
ncbi:hypothetical protein K435DRAFT_866923 [Dendrothele bispora CBS 962.96]|uniref:Uncharacterized protein n=1 Tax=Dendrothele bispora (strain CBS 962.96) TaxID=1314807 RepID=A0A4S8LFN4_DENBC|nr:hypothetical protein K435DRAFT_866923 [Dendrothele bispora CBS 962.96]